MRRVLSITKALSDENRVRALMALQGGELCLCQLVELLQLAPSTASKHMSILVQADLVEIRKDGRWHYYRLADASPEVRATREWIAGVLGNDRQVAADARELKKICRRLKGAATECCKD